MEMLPKIIWSESAFSGNSVIHERLLSTGSGTEKILFSVKRAKMQINAAQSLRKNPNDQEKLLSGAKALLEAIEKKLEEEFF